ncbi:DMT family transporter [Frankia sp. AgB32]|uniref:DMT family transporter n=1 Tax=Frankia sp. AgB32 TaxID=631119 RepID=UPI00200ECFB7|nr:DMT family transporter [Frankia sp. AgB32]MCK9898362.1 DMT family transporter [Frankia sp. AgB32]
MSALAAVVVALAAAACFALASALQHHAASQEPVHPALDPRLLVRLVRRPSWLIGGVSDVAGLGLQTLALGLGALAVVQVLLVSGLFLAVPLEAALERRRPRGRDLTAVTLASVALAVLLLTAAPSDGISEPSEGAWLLIAVTVGPMIVLTLGLARRTSAAGRVACLGLATGLCYGVSAGLMKDCVVRLGTDPVHLLVDWQLYALVGIGAVGYVLNQNAFQDSLAVPLIMITLVDPVVSTVIGITAFHEHLATGGVRVPILVLAAVAVVVGTWLATTGRPAVRGPGRTLPPPKQARQGVSGVSGFAADEQRASVR